LSSILIEFEQKRIKENNKKKDKKQINEQPWTLVYTLVLQIMSSPLSFFLFGLDQLVFLPK
jgi:hypothetical protein